MDHDTKAQFILCLQEFATVRHAALARGTRPTLYDMYLPAISTALPDLDSFCLFFIYKNNKSILAGGLIVVLLWHWSSPKLCWVLFLIYTVSVIETQTANRQRSWGFLTARLSSRDHLSAEVSPNA